jgi:hypothetical protein
MLAAASEHAVLQLLPSFPCDSIPFLSPALFPQVVPEPEGPGDDARILILGDPIFIEDRSSPPGHALHPEHHLRAEVTDIYLKI